MNNIKKIGLTALAGSLVATTAFAAELSVSGGAALYMDQPNNNAVKGNSFYMGDSVTFSGSGEMDNGWTVSVSYELDGGAQSSAGSTGGTATATSNVGGTNVLDSHSMTIDMGDTGSITFSGHGGDSALSLLDDKTPNAYEESCDVVSGADGSVVNGVSGNNMFMYKSPTVSGAQVMLSYINASDAVTDKSYMDFGVTVSPEAFDGLNIGYATGDDESVTGTTNSEDTMYVTYAYGAATVGFQRGNRDTNQGANDIQTTSVGISYAISDDFSVAYNQNDVSYEASAKVDQEATGISLSYTMGSMSLSGAMNTVDNIGGATATDREGYEFELAFAF
jgi:outer membrane protein OmpU